MKESNAKAQSVSIVRVARAIDVLADAPEGISLDELASQLDMSRPAAMRLFESMADTGIAVRMDARRYRLALKAHEWGNRALANYAPSLTARREMARLATEVHHRVWYAVLEGPYVMTIERTELIDNETVSFPVANRSPWWLTASGIIIAAFLPEQRRNELLRTVGSEIDLDSISVPPRQREVLHAASSSATHDPKELAGILETARQSGLARLSYGELGSALAAPVLDSSGSAAASVGITVLNGEDFEVETLERRLKEAAARCSNYLGYSRTFLVT